MLPIAVAHRRCPLLLHIAIAHCPCCCECQFFTCEDESMWTGAWEEGVWGCEHGAWGLEHGEGTVVLFFSGCPLSKKFMETGQWGYFVLVVFCQIFLIKWYKFWHFFLVVFFQTKNYQMISVHTSIDHRHSVTVAYCRCPSPLPVAIALCRCPSPLPVAVSDNFLHVRMVACGQ